jgi:DNA polymerase-3 subunit beta
MKLSIQRETLLKPLQFAASIADRRPTLPVLGNVLLEVTEDQLMIVGSDGEIELKGVLALVEPAEVGAITVPARKFLDICRSLPDNSMVEIELMQPQQESRKSGLQLQIRSGRSKFLLATLPAVEFPITPEVTATGEVEIQQNILGDLIKQTHFAMAQQDVRHYLNGVLLELAPSQVNMVATDGHRLAISSVALNVDHHAQVIIPRKAVLELLKLLSDSDVPVKLVLSATQLRMVSAEYVLTTKIIDSKFPDYQRVIPRNSDKEIVLDRDVLKQALMRAGILANEKNRGVRLGLRPNSLHVTAHNPEQEEAQEELEIAYSGKALEIGFNVGYLIDVLNTVAPGKVTLSLSNDSTSALLEGVNVNTSAVYVIMPMRI